MENRRSSEPAILLFTGEFLAGEGPERQIGLLRVCCAGAEGGLGEIVFVTMMVERW
jgi:hypothetical protein